MENVVLNITQSNLIISGPKIKHKSNSQTHSLSHLLEIFFSPNVGKMLRATGVPCWEYGTCLWWYSDICCYTTHKLLLLLKFRVMHAESPRMPGQENKNEAQSMKPSKKKPHGVIFHHFTLNISSPHQWQGRHFQQTYWDRHSHICSELSECVITSLWELSYHNRERERLKCALRKRLAKAYSAL